jgi:anti-anti-sigma regulatory factor
MGLREKTAIREKLLNIPPGGKKMSAIFSITYTGHGQFQVRIVGNLSGHVARNGLALLQSAVEAGNREIKLDLEEMTSVDSLGIAIFNWLQSRNGNLKVDIALPIIGVSEDQLAYIAQASSSVNKPKRRYDTSHEKEKT